MTHKKIAQMLECSNTLAKSTFFSINRGTFISNFSTLTVHSISYFCHCKLHLIFTATHFVSCVTFNSCTLIRTPFDTSIAKFISIATSNIQFSSITSISDFHWDLHKKSNFMLQTRKFSFHFIPSLQLRSSLLRFGIHRLSRFVQRWLWISFHSTFLNLYHPIQCNNYPPPIRDLCFIDALGCPDSMGFSSSIKNSGTL